MLTDARRHELRNELLDMSAAQAAYFTISQSLPPPMRQLNGLMVTLVAHWRDSLANDREPTMDLVHAMINYTQSVLAKIALENPT